MVKKSYQIVKFIQVLFFCLTSGASYPNNNKVSQMLYNKNLYHQRPPLQPIQHTSYNLRTNCHQLINKNYTKTYQEPVSSKKRIDGYDRSNSKSYRKNVYQIESRDMNRRAKHYCPLSKQKTAIDDEVIKKSREYMQSSKYNNYMEIVSSSSKNREDLIENMKKVRSNNIYLPVSQREIQQSTLIPKSLTRRPIFNKNQFADNNQDSSQDFDFTIDHLSKIEEKQIVSQENKNTESFQPKNNYNYTPKSDLKKQKPVILIQDQFKDQLVQEEEQLRKRNRKTPEYAISPTFPTPVKRGYNKGEEQYQTSQTKLRYTVALTPPQNKVSKVENINRFVDYQEIKQFQKTKKSHERQTNEKYAYLSNQKNLFQRQASINRMQSKINFAKAVQRSPVGLKFESSVQTLQSSIYNVDFKLQRPMSHVQSQKILKKLICNKFQSQNRVNNFTENRQTGWNMNYNQNSTYSRSRSKGKLSIVTTSKPTHFY